MCCVGVCQFSDYVTIGHSYSFLVRKDFLWTKGELPVTTLVFSCPLPCWRPLCEQLEVRL